MYTLLTGRPPCQGVSLLETISRIRQSEPERPKRYQMSIPDHLENTLMRMLAKKPEDRYQTAALLRADLARIGK